MHSGADVVQGVKYTMRSDIMYEFDDGNDDHDGGAAVLSEFLSLRPDRWVLEFVE